MKKTEGYHSRVYTERPDYADLPSSEKFQAIIGIIMTRLKQHPIKEDKIEWAGRTLHRIRALKDFSDVKKGDFGGYIEMEENLSQEGSAWVYGSAEVYGSARVQEDEDYMFFGSFGSEGRTTTVYRTKTGCEVRCGCFNGTLEEFRARVKETHGDNQYAKEYFAIADIAEMRFGKENDNAADRN